MELIEERSQPQEGDEPLQFKSECACCTLLHWLMTRLTAYAGTLAQH